MDLSLLVGEKVTTDCKVYITRIEEGSAFLTVSVEVCRCSWLHFYMAGCMHLRECQSSGVPSETELFFHGSSGTDTSNLFIMALKANSIASVFIQLAVNSSSMAWSLSSESISGHIGAWSEVPEIMSGKEGKSGAVCMEEVVASEALSLIP